MRTQLVAFAFGITITQTGCGTAKAMDAGAIDVATAVDAEMADVAIVVDANIPDASPPVDAAPPDAIVIPDPPMAFVAEGPFWMGCNASIDGACESFVFDDEDPYHEVTISDYQIDVYETTSADYALCSTIGPCTPIPGLVPTSLPATSVTWDQASTYCEWIGRRLPTEAEWEKAARGNDGRVFPWGNDPPTMDKTGPHDIHEIGMYPMGASPYGVHDMAANAMEWVSDYYGMSYYSFAPPTDPQGPTTGLGRSVRSLGLLYAVDTWNGTSRRHALTPDTSDPETAFRCARSIP